MITLGQRPVEEDWLYLHKETEEIDELPPSPEVGVEIQDSFDSLYIGEMNQSPDERIRKIGQVLHGQGMVWVVTETRGNVVFRNTHFTRVLTLADLQALVGTRWKERFTALLELDRSIAEINLHFPFYERLQTVAAPILKTVSLYHLQRLTVLTPFNQSVVWLALAPDEDLARLSINRLALDFPSVPPVLYLRLKALREWAAEPNSVAQVALYRAEELERSSIPDGAFSLLTDEQVIGLNFSKLNLQQIRKALTGGEGSEESLRRRVSALSDSQFTEVLTRATDLLESMPEERYSNLPLSRLAADQISIFFPQRSSEAAKKADRAHFGKIPAQEVLDAIPILTSWQMELITDEQIQRIDWTQVNRNIFEMVFFNWTYGETLKRHRISLLPHTALILFIQKAYWSICKYLSDAQVRGFGTRECPIPLFEAIFLDGLLDLEIKRHRVSLLEPEIVFHFFGKVNSSIYCYLSDACYRSLPLSRIEEGQIDELFPVPFSASEIQESKRRFALIPTEELVHTLPRLKDRHIDLISDRQIQEIDWTQVTPDLFQKIVLFWTFDDRERKHRLSLIDPQIVFSFMGKVLPLFYKYLSDPQIRLIGEKTQVPEIFYEVFLSWKYDHFEQRRRVAMLGAETVSRFIGELKGDQIRLLTYDQMEELNLESLREDQIDGLFPSFATKTLFPGYNYAFEPDYWGDRHIYRQIRPTGSSRQSLKDEELQKEITERRQICLQNLARFPSPKLEPIRNKLKPEVAALLGE